MDIRLVVSNLFYYRIFLALRAKNVKFVNVPTTLSQ